MNEKHSSAYLIKRNPELTDVGVIIKRHDKNKFFSETTIKNDKPVSDKLEIGDKIYVHETGCGIYARGVVTDVKQIIRFKTIDSVIDHYSCKKKKAKYWLEQIVKFKKALEAKMDSVLKYQEYEVDLKLLDRTIPLEGELEKLKYSQTMVSIPERIVKYIEEEPLFHVVKELKLDIPGSLKLDLHSMFNKKVRIEHWIDIDHFVPKSAGAPGNIIENLVPVGFGLNRYKSDSIPKGFFIVAAKNPKLNTFMSISYNEYMQDEYLRKSKHPIAFANCQKINSYIKSNFSIEEARTFYKDVLHEHFEKYTELIGVSS